MRKSTQPLHICFISQEYPPDTGWGGIGSYTYEMAHGLVQAGHRATVIARAVGQERVLNDAGVEVHRLLPAPDWNRLRGAWRMNKIWPGFAWAAMRRVRQIHARTPVDVVEAAECRGDGVFLPWIRRHPALITRLHTAWIFVDRMNLIQPDRKKRLTYYLERQAIEHATAITSPSQAMVELTNTWLSLGEKDINIVPNPVNCGTFSPGSAPRKQEVLFVGRLERRKGVEMLVRALPHVLSRCPEATFRFIGSDGPDPYGRSWRERLVSGLTSAERAQVYFEQVPRDALIDRYRRAAICVMPSGWENFPYGLLEAMSCGTPVVATRAGGLPELVEHGVTGLLVEPGDSLGLADALCDLLEHAGRREELGRNARTQVEASLSVERVVPRMIDVYQAALALH
ncbi:MAG: glycosyltransferase family 4 protein [Kouleothrix sp.]|nr:glycosyltransferase family 4 protein [Kouleothrix sp.]